MVLLGLTWVFGAIAIGSARLVFQYVFCIFNSLQGFAIFWFHCVRQSEVRECWVDFLCRKGTRKRRYTASTTIPAVKKHSMSPKMTSDQRSVADKCDNKMQNIEANPNSTIPVWDVAYSLWHAFTKCALKRSGVKAQRAALRGRKIQIWHILGTWNISQCWRNKTSKTLAHSEIYNSIETVA